MLKLKGTGLIGRFVNWFRGLLDPCASSPTKRPRKFLIMANMPWSKADYCMPAGRPEVVLGVSEQWNGLFPGSRPGTCPFWRKPGGGLIPLPGFQLQRPEFWPTHWLANGWATGNHLTTGGYTSVVDRSNAVEFWVQSVPEDRWSLLGGQARGGTGMSVLSGSSSVAVALCDGDPAIVDGGRVVVPARPGQTKRVILVIAYGVGDCAAGVFGLEVKRPKAPSGAIEFTPYDPGVRYDVYGKYPDTPMAVALG